MSKQTSAFIKGFFAGFEPTPNVNIWQWADKYRVLPKGSAEPGNWRTKRTPYLKEIMEELSPQSPTAKVIVIKGTQLGFALDVKTLIPTANGWTTMKNIKVGDNIFDELGNIVKVTYVSPIYYNHKCYEVTFSDGSKIITDANHKWAVDRYVGSTFKRFEKIITNTEAMSFDFKHKNRNRYAIDVAKPLKINNKDVEIDPYLLGMWLSNGNSYNNRITVDKKVAQKYLEILESKNIKAKITDIHSKGNATEIVFYGIYPKIHKLIGAKKHIPMRILRSNEKYRLELLQGLIDGDGHITKNGYCEYYSASRKLINDVKELLLTLGLKPIIAEKKQKNKNIINGREIHQSEVIYRITFKAYKSNKIAKLKAYRLTDINNGRPTETFRRRIIDVKQVLSVPVRCIEVNSKSHLYLASKNFIPTHNTEVGNNMIGYYIHIEPRAGGMWLPTDALAEKHAKKKLWKMVEETPVLKARVSERRKGGSASKESSTILEWAFPGGSLSLAGSGSGSSFRSDSYSFAIKDDIDGFVDDVDGEGSPIELIDNRTDAFANRKIYENSTPTRANNSHIETEYEESDQREYYMPCPHCTPKDKNKQNMENMVKFDFENFYFEYDKESFKLLSKEIVMICPHCGGEIEEYQKTWMMDWDNGAKWIPNNPGHVNRGYKLSSLYSPLGWRSWKDIILEWLKAQSKMKIGDTRLMKRWKNTRLAEVWEDDYSKLDINFLKEKQEEYEKEVPFGVYVLIASVDTQEDRLEILVEGFGLDDESWIVDREILFGDPALPDVWEDLDRFLLNQTYEHDNGKMKIYATGIDSGGSKTKYVYQYCKPRYGKRIYALKGAKPIEAPAVTKRDAKRSKYKTTFFMIGVNQLKDVVWSSLGITVPGPTYTHFPKNKKFNDDFFEQLISEKRDNTGRWKKRKPTVRNEAFDLMVYTRATLEITGLNISKLKEPIFYNQTSQPRRKRRVISRGVV